MCTYSPPIEETMNEYQVELLKEVKCESIGEFLVLSRNYMDEDADLLSWPNELTYPASAFNAAAPEEGSTESHESLNPTGRKRMLWENDGAQQPQLKRIATEPTGEQPTKEENESKSVVIANGLDNGESTLPLWQNEDVSTGFETGLAGLGNEYNMNDTLLTSHSLTVFKQEGPSEAASIHVDNDTTLQSLLQNNGFPSRPEQDCRFQYVLAAATSIASKQGEETLTYLNQGQSYGIKLKKVGELLAFKGKLLKSVIRLQFHERRLQYSEKEQILAWQEAHPGERIVELDVPLSYGLFDVEHDSTMVNTLCFCWDPTQEVGAYIKVNSISTEFTPKKHGGEKGVPFRIQVETYIQGDNFRLHAAACQIRVFKLKGADRKHKQEREKWQKLPESERTKYQPPYESTILSDISPDAAVPVQPFVSTTVDMGGRAPPPVRVNTQAARGARSAGHIPALPSSADVAAKMEEGAGEALSPVPPMAPPALDSLPVSKQADQFTVEMGREQVSAWLLKNGFEMLTNTFCHFSGPDMLRLTREDLVSMCGLPNGLRLFYALRSKPAIRLTIYVSPPGKSLYVAVYLATAKRTELMRKLATLMNMADVSTFELLMAGPNGIHVLVNDELLSNIPNETAFSLNVLQDDASGRCCILLKSTTA